MRAAIRPVVLSALVAITVLATTSIVSSANVGFQFDFRGDLYNAAHAILRGANPYHPEVLATEARILRSGGQLNWIASPRYPPILMLAVVPISLVPFPLAGMMWLVLSAASVIIALRLLGVRDWRCIVLASLSSSAAFGIWIGNVSSLLFLGAAVMWRFRSRSNLLVATAAAVIGAKLILWPLAGWLLATRRYRQFCATVLLTGLGILAAWAVIGFAGLSTYPRMLLDVAFIGERRGSSLVTVLLDLGLSVEVARALARAITECCGRR